MGNDLAGTEQNRQVNLIAFSDGARTSVQELLATTKQEADRLKKEAERAAQVMEIWNQMFTYLCKGWPLHVINLIDFNNPYFKQLRADNHPIVPVVEDIYRTARDLAKNNMRRFPLLFEKACIAANYSLGRDSAHPRYRLMDNFFAVEINEGKGNAVISDYEGRLEEVPADPEAIIEVIQREYKRIFDRPFDGPAFLTKLRNQYLAIIKQEKKVDGDSIPIRHVTRRLGKNQKGFRTDEFLIDLSRLVKEGPKEVNGFILDLQNTRDSDGMILYGHEMRGRIGFIKFRRVSE